MGRVGRTGIQEKSSEANTWIRAETYLEKMPEILFPEKWWKLSPEEYNESKLALKGLIAKDPDSGNAEVVFERRKVSRG